MRLCRLGGYRGRASGLQNGSSKGPSSIHALRLEAQEFPFPRWFLLFWISKGLQQNGRGTCTLYWRCSGGSCNRWGLQEPVILSSDFRKDKEMRCLKAHDAQNLRMLSQFLAFFFLTEEETHLEKAVNCPKSQSFETSPHHITMRSVSRIPWRKNVRKPLCFLPLYASSCSGLTERTVTMVLSWSQLRGGRGRNELLSSKGKNLWKIIDCHLKYFQMSAFERESELRERTSTSDFVGGYHLPQTLVNPKFCLFARHSGFYFLTPPWPSLRLRLMLFISLTPWCISHISASQMLVFWLGSGGDKERLLAWLGPCLAPKYESGFWFFLPERGFQAKQPCWDVLQF